MRMTLQKTVGLRTIVNIELLTAMSGGKWLNDYSVAANPACNHPVCTAIFSIIEPKLAAIGISLKSDLSPIQ